MARLYEELDMFPWGVFIGLWAGKEVGETAGELSAGETQDKSEAESFGEAIGLLWVTLTAAAVWVCIHWGIEFNGILGLTIVLAPTVLSIILIILGPILVVLGNNKNEQK